jgi:hypothetical protein
MTEPRERESMAARFLRAGRERVDEGSPQQVSPQGA